MAVNNRDSEILVGLYLGTGKISAAVAEIADETPGEAQIIAIGEAPSKGFRKGMIVSLEQAVASVADAVADAEAALGDVKINSAVVAFSALDVRSAMLHSSLSLGKSPRPIGVQDLKSVIAKAVENVALPQGFCVLHAIPMKYAVDGNRGIDDPLGMTGEVLDVELLAVAVQRTVVQNVANCVEKAGIAVRGLVLKSLVSALGALTLEERVMGASVVSIGAGSTGIAAFRDGKLAKVGEIPIGGDHVTNDLSCILKIPFSYAENLKKDIDITPDLEYNGTKRVDNRGHEQEFENAEIAAIIKSRLEELLSDRVARFLSDMLLSGVPTHVVLSGGLAKSQGIVEFAAQCLDTTVSVASPVLQKQMPPGRNDCRYVGVSGIIVYIMEKKHHPFVCVDAPLSLFTSPISLSSGSEGKKRRGASVKSFAEALQKGADIVKELIKELF